MQKKPTPRALKRKSGKWTGRDLEEVFHYVEDMLPDLAASARAQGYSHLDSELAGTFLSSRQFVRVLEKYDPEGASIKAMVLTAFRSHCRDYVRWLWAGTRRRKYRSITIPAGDEQTSGQVGATDGRRRPIFVEATDGSLPPAEEDVEEQVITRDAQRLGRMALGRLPARQRRLLVAYFKGASMSEIAAHFGLKNANVAKVRLYEARHRLRAEAQAIGMLAPIVEPPSELVGILAEPTSPEVRK